MQYHIFDYRGEAKHVAAVTVDPTGDNYRTSANGPVLGVSPAVFIPRLFRPLRRCEMRKTAPDFEGFVLISENEIAWRE